MAKESREVLPGASVAVYNQSDSLYDGTVTDSEGIFRINSLPPGTYYLQIGFIGFVTDTIKNLRLTQTTDVGRIRLRPSEILLHDVVVTSEKPLYTFNLDKKVYHVDRDIMAETSSASEILQNVPSVNVDINGGITLRNTSNITFFLNGKPSALLRRNPSAILDQIPANMIERIEVITNPSANYRPDGVGGIINIVLKKDAQNGLNGQIGIHGGNEKRYNANLNINYGTQDLKIFGNYGIRHSNARRLFSDQRTYKDSTESPNSYYDESTVSNRNRLSHNVFLAANYKINEYNAMELSGSYFNQNSFHHGRSSISSLDSFKNPVYNLKSVETNDELEQEDEASITLEHVFKNNEDHTLSFEGVYSSYNEKEDKIFDQNYSFPKTGTEIRDYLIEKSGNQKEINIEYELPVGEDAGFESGYSGEFIFDNIRYDKNGELSQFKFNQQVHAAYALFRQSIEDFSYKAGLRAEQTTIESHLVLPDDGHFPNNYFKLFPSLYLGYDLSENKIISLSYSKRVNRPDPDELNPNPEYSDPRNAESGNPYLKPEQVHSLELGYRLVQNEYSLTSSMYYRYTYDAFTRIYKNVGDSLVLYSATNLTTRHSAGIETIFSGKFLNKHTFNLTGDVFYTTLNASNLGYSDNRSTISGNIKAFSLVKIAKKTSLQVNAYYYFPSTTPQGSRESFYYFNLGFKQTLFKNHASLTLTGTDIFHTYKIEHTVTSADLNQKTTFQRRSPVFYIGFMWRFNNFEDKDKINFEEN